MHTPIIILLCRINDKQFEDNMKQQPFVTIAIPVKNGADFLDYTLTNVFLSDYPSDRYEVIAGNHGSTDSSRAIIDTYLKNTLISRQLISNTMDRTGPAPVTGL